MEFVPIVFTTSGGMGEQFQRRYWNPHWIRVAEEDEAMKIGPWVARKRKAFWEARFAVAVANCNAGMISRSQHHRLVYSVQGKENWSSRFPSPH